MKSDISVINDLALERIEPGMWDRFFKGDRSACARLITYVENDAELVPVIRNMLFPRLKGAVRIGITGPPGVGKSTVTTTFTQLARSAGKKVGIIAVDPSSPFSGGAFLGDRIRMQKLIGDPGVFIRSVASRDGHGGLSPTTPYIADIFDAFGMDWVLIETVGVGQAELDILTCADVIVIVLQPGTGDAIQALKTGILETGDLFLINKSDLPGADQLRQSLCFTFEMSAVGEPPPIVLTSALNGDGMNEAFETLVSLIDAFHRTGRFSEKRLNRMVNEIEAALRDVLWERFVRISDVADRIRNVADELLRENRSPYPFIVDVYTRIRMEYDGETKSGT